MKSTMRQEKVEKIYQFSLEARYNDTIDPFAYGIERKNWNRAEEDESFFLALLIPTTLHQPPYEALRPLKRFPVSRLNLLKRAARFRMGQLFLPLAPTVTVVIYSALYLSPEVFPRT